MDNLRSLNRSLPHPKSTMTTPLPETNPPEALLQTFKEAALSVTQLYKQAASSHKHARLEGYQEALHDVLHYLDNKENIGTREEGDGQQQMRAWVIARLGGEQHQHPPATTTGGGDESEDEREGTAEAMVESKPGTTTTTTTNTTTAAPPPAPVPPPPSAPEMSPKRYQPAALPLSSPETFRSNNNPQRVTTDFTFRADLPPGMDLDASSSSETTPPPPPPHYAVRASTRRKQQQQQAKTNKNLGLGLGTGAGTKRKLVMGDFFDLSDLKEFGTGGKKGRTS